MKKRYKCELEEEIKKISKEGIFTYNFDDNSFIIGEINQGKKQGLWLYYNSYGEEIKSEFYKNNKKIFED